MPVGTDQQLIKRVGLQLGLGGTQRAWRDREMTQRERSQDRQTDRQDWRGAWGGGGGGKSLKCRASYFDQPAKVAAIDQLAPFSEHLAHDLSNLWNCHHHLRCDYV